MHDQPGDLKKINSAPSEEDVFGLVMAYYDDEDESPDQRYLCFFKGNILTPDNHQVRGNESFYTTKDSRELFFK